LKADGKATSVGDEGGFAPDIKTDEEAFGYIIEAIEKAGYKPGTDFVLAMDAASSEWKGSKKGEYHLPKSGKNFTSAELVAHWKALTDKYPIYSLEDGLDDLRYNKVIVATDADVDGAHIRTLLLTFFYRFMTPLIEKGYVYAAQPPLFRVKQGKEIHYTYSDAEQDKLLAELKAHNKSTKIEIQRYKGLGEMDFNQLWETTMDYNHRTLVQIKIEDATAADEIFTTLMGDKVPPRKKFIEDNARYATLDI